MYSTMHFVLLLAALSMGDQVEPRISVKKEIELPHENLSQTVQEEIVREVMTGSTNEIRNERRVLQLNYSRGIDTQPEACPTWMLHNQSTPNRTCHCGSSLEYIVSCNSTTKQTNLLTSYCMTYSNTTGAVVGECLLGNYHKRLKQDQDTTHYKLPSNISQLNDMMCVPFNRSGQLCGQCKDGFSPTVYSYNFKCQNCTESQVKNWITYIVVAFLPLTVFYFLVVLFKFNANAPHLNSFIFVSQLFSSSVNVRSGNLLLREHRQLQIPLKVIVTLYGIWNLDFFREVYPDICLNINTLTAMALDYVVAFYPLLLIGVSYLTIKLHSRDFKPCIILGKPFLWCASHFRKPNNISRSMIDVFATFLLLSYVRVMTVTFDLLVYTRVRDINGTLVGKYLYYTPTVEWFQHHHFPYALTALLIGLCFNILPLCILIAYPRKTFHKCLNYFKYRQQSLHIFADSFQGCYKDGTNGTIDCRYFAALPLFVRLFLLVIYAYTLSSFFYSLGAVVLMANCLLYAIFQPYKKKFDAYNNVNVAMFLIAAMWFGSIQCFQMANIKGKVYLNLSVALSTIISILPLMYLSAYVIVQLSKKLKWCTVCTKKNRQEELPSKESLLSVPDRIVNPNCYYGSMD